MEKPILLFPYSVDEFRGIINSEINEVLKRFNLNSSPSDSEKLLSRKEAAFKLNISLATLDSYTKQGLIQSYIIGRRVLFKESEIEKSLYQVKTVKY